MIQFELLGVTGLTSPKDEGENELSMAVSIKVGVVGLPNEPKYYLPPAPIQTFVWNKKGMDSDQVQKALEAWAAEWVKANYPSI